ncbi:MAG: DUF1735 domain-containing protein [Bacteroidetes bacterium]|nr:DUF1735 domain-containing protein [Bacteroidota bacterium]MCC7377773.1 DUF1735 domain-containing protein [Chitinophagaceae bacterium]
MKYINLKKQLAILTIAAFTFSACKKISTPEPMGDAGQTIVKILNGGVASDPSVISEAISFVNTPYTLSKAVVDIRRDVPNNGALNGTTVITIKDDTSAVTNFNNTNQSGLYLYQLPANWYTIVPAAGIVKTGGQGGNYTVTFAPGEFAKQIEINIPDATVLDPSNLYALAFTITTIDATGKISQVANSVILQIGAKNNYDGVYTDDFCNYHPSSNPGYTCASTEVELITTGANACKIYWPLAGAFAQPSILGGGFSYFGAQEPEYTVNPSTFAVTVQNAYVGATTFYTMSAGYNSHYDPPSKTFYVKYGYNNPGGVFDPAATREWTQTLKYTGPR